MGNAESRKARAIDDRLLQNATGGVLRSYSGGGFGETSIVPYVCPACGGAIRFSSWLRYHCVSCDESWYDASALVPNTRSNR